MTEYGLDLNESIVFSGQIKPIEAARIVTEFSEDSVEIRYRGDIYENVEAPLTDATRYIQDLLSKDPDTLEEKVEQNTMPENFYLDKRDADILNEMNPSPIPRPDHLEVNSAEVLKAGVAGNQTGYAIDFAVNNKLDDFADQAQVTFNYWEDLPNGRELDKLAHAVDSWRNTTAYELLE